MKLESLLFWSSVLVSLLAMAGCSSFPFNSNAPQKVTWNSPPQEIPGIPGKWVSLPGKTWKIMAYEVTFAQWDSCVDAGACNGYKPADKGWGRGQRPVINVSYDDVQTYIKWLHQKSGRTFRLPTEEEWAFAARGDDDQEWYKDMKCSHARYGRRPGGECSNTADGTVEVGSHAANTFGLFDMAGNVWEWTDSCWNGECAERVVRGGSWSQYADSEPLPLRAWGAASNRYDAIGFRLIQIP